MSGSKTTTSRCEAALRAMRTPPPGGYFAWDGADENERPASRAEMRAGMAQYRKKRGRPPGSGSNKVPTTIRFDADIVEAFRAAGPGWQTRMNAALRDWLEQYPPK